MSEKPPKWPEPRHRTKLSDDHLIAIGLINLHYNHLEDFIKTIAEKEAGEKAPIRRFVRKLSNRDRVDLLAGMIEESDKEVLVRDAFLTGLKHFDICAENRNIIMHSVDDDNDIFRKWPSDTKRPDKAAYFVDLATLRTVAVETSETFHYLLDTAIYDFSLTSGLSPDPRLLNPGLVPPTLPEKPAQPGSLIPLRPPRDR